MKLRNKKTGEIGRLYSDHQLIDPKTGTYAIVIQHRDKLGYEAFANYFTLAELNEEWEDYKPAEPLIKDEKIRKAVKAWAEVVGKEETFVVSYNTEYHDCCIYTGGLSNTAMIDLGTDLNISEDSYTIAELCGEEEI